MRCANTRARRTRRRAEASPLAFVPEDSPRRFDSQLSFAMMMNLVSALGSPDRDFIWNYLTGYDPAIAGDPETEAMGRTLMECALNYYNDFIAPKKTPYVPPEAEREQLDAIANWLSANENASAEEIEKKIYDFGREYYDKPGKIFPLLYRTLLSQERGPRLGAFIRLATPARIVELLNAATTRS